MQDKGGGKGGHFYPESTPHNTCKNHLTDVPELGSGTSCTLVPSLILHTPLAPAPLAVLATCRFPAVRALRQDSKPSRSAFPFLLVSQGCPGQLQVSARVTSSSARPPQGNAVVPSLLSSLHFVYNSPLPVSQELVCLSFHQTLSSLKAGVCILSFHLPISAANACAWLTVAAQPTFTGKSNGWDHLCPS